MTMLSAETSSALVGKRVFLTGGTGLFGKWLIASLATLDLELVILSRNPNGFQKAFPLTGLARISFIQGDIRSFEFSEGAFDYLIHAAAPVVSDSMGYNDPEVREIIEKGTRHVLRFAKTNRISKVLFVSSGAVYGPQASGLEKLTEQEPCVPITQYGIGKLEAERLCIASGLDVRVARCFTFVGPGMPLDSHLAIGNFMGNALRGEPIEINGDGTPIRSYMHSDDLVEWLLTLLIFGRKGEVYNVGSDVPISMEALAERIQRIAGSEEGVAIATPRVEGPSARYMPSIEKVRDELGLTLHVDLDDALRTTIASYKEARSLI